MINMTDKYLMMIEPDQIGRPSEEPIMDELTEKMMYVFSQAEKSSYNFKGIHITKCGKTSDNRDWILPNGMKTHTLAVYYIQHYRPYIPEEEIEKLEQLYRELKNQYYLH